MHSKTTALIHLAWAISIACVGAAEVSGADDAAFIVTQGATVDGRLDGTLQVLADDGAVHIGTQAEVAGDLVVPPDKSRAPGLSNRAGAPKELSPSAEIALDNRGGAGALRGTLRTAEKFVVPAVIYSGRPTTTRDVVVNNEGEAIDFKGLGNLTIDHPKALIVLPPGSYGDVAVRQGTLLVGFGAGPQSSRYELGRLDVEESGRVLVAGAVAITVEEGGTWRGKLGDEANPYWLDLRVGRGDVTLGVGARFNGFLSAPSSLVTISASATLKGELVARQLTVEDQAIASVVSPEWTAAKGKGTAPAFSHRALRLQRELPNLQHRLQGQASAAVSYPADFPFVMISGKPSADGEVAAAREQYSLFEAFCALFGDTGFERAGVVLTTPTEATAGKPPTVRNVILTSVQFGQLLHDLGAKSSKAENIEAVRASPKFLERFMTRALELGFVPTRRP